MPPSKYYGETDTFGDPRFGDISCRLLGSTELVAFPGRPSAHIVSQRWLCPRIKVTHRGPLQGPVLRAGHGLGLARSGSETAYDTAPEELRVSFYSSHY